MPLGHTLILWVCLFSIQLGHTLRADVRRHDGEPVIYKGRTIAQNEYPAVGMLFTGKRMCTGTALGGSCVLTASHCTLEKGKTEFSTATTFGKDSWKVSEEPIHHPQANHSLTFDLGLHDLAIVKLDRPLSTGVAAPKEILATERLKEAPGVKSVGIVVGAGAYDDASAGMIARTAGVKRIGRVHFHTYSNDGTFFGTSALPGQARSKETGSPLLPGDSGSPVFFRDADGKLRIHGVLHGGGYYSSVPNDIGWIRDTMKKLGCSDNANPANLDDSVREQDVSSEKSQTRQRIRDLVLNRFRNFRRVFTAETRLEAGIATPTLEDSPRRVEEGNENQPPADAVRELTAELRRETGIATLTLDSWRRVPEGNVIPLRRDNRDLGRLLVRDDGTVVLTLDGTSREL